MRPLPTLHAGLLLLGIAFFCRCAGIASRRSVKTSPAEYVADTGTKGWWAVRFQINWPEDTPPSWYMDTLIARQVVAQALDHSSILGALNGAAAA